MRHIYSLAQQAPRQTYTPCPADESGRMLVYLRCSLAFRLCSLRWAQRAAQPRHCLRQKQPRRSRGKHSDRVLRTKQGAVFGAALQFSQGRTVARWENWLSARGQRSAFCEGAATPEAKTGHRNPEQGGMVFLCFAALPFNTLSLFLFVRCARPRGGREGVSTPPPYPLWIPYPS